MAVRFQLGFCWEDLIEGRKSMFASSTEEIKEDRKHAVAVPKESETITKSCYFGPGPHFRRVLFKLGGQSPLISYYLKMHEITNVSSSLTYKMKRTEIYKLPPVAPTYRDVIKERQRLRKEFQEDYTVQQNKHKEAIEEIKQQRKKTDQQFQRLIENKSMHPTELRLSTDLLMNELEATIKKKSSSLIPVLEEMNKPQH
ncbi:protein FAM227B [Alligator sinensis]|uniref:Protein FAM227B n=1 Tax=Alligator sinensis TaxID=38654 RepID=A0A1U7SBV7_ALLSI|nr:protein FAM227B [Alligator sinensis]